MKNTDSNEVKVIGGGIGGLTAAAIIARAGHAVTVHEQRGRLGGRATTDDRRGYRFNQGPHALYLGGEAVRALRRLGVHPSGVAPPTKAALMALGGETYLAPFGARSLIRTKMLSTRDKVELARVLSRIPSVAPSSLAQNTEREWVGQLTTRPRVAGIVHALARLTTYANAPDVMSAEVVASQLQLALADGVTYLDGGWQQLVHELRRLVVAAGGTICAGEALVDLPDARIVIVAAGGPSNASTLTGHSFDPGVAAYASCLDLGLTGPPVHQFVIGIDEPNYLSAHGLAGDMTPPGAASVSVARYLKPDEAPDRKVLQDFSRHAGIGSSDIVEERYLHRMCTVTALPIAENGGYSGRPPVAVPGLRGVFVVGDWVGDKGHLADAVLASAQQAARSAIGMLAGAAVSA